MENDFLTFGSGIALLIVALIFSAMTEMGTKLPWKKKPESDRSKVTPR